MNYFILTIITIGLLVLVPSNGFSQDPGFNKQTCNARIQGTWDLFEARKGLRKITSDYEGIVLKFDGDTLFYINYIFGDTLVGRFYAWTEIVEITEAIKLDDFCDDDDDDICNDCEYRYETRLEQQNSLSVVLRSVNGNQKKKLNWKNFLLIENGLNFEYPEKGRKIRFTFSKRRT